jgi:membrane-associated phospholipid phosphatase
MRTFLNPADRLTVIFLGMLTAVVLLFVRSIPAWPQLVAHYALLVFTITALAVLHERAPRSRLFDVLHSFIPVIAVPVIFNSLGDIIPFVRTRYYDDVLIRIDHLLFGVHPTVWLERFTFAPLTAILQLAYISYYFMPIALGASLLLKKKRGEFDTAVFMVVLCFYLSYIGYLLVPAVGPRFALDHLQTADLHAGPATRWIQHTLNSLEHTKTDAFPSGHTAVALVSLYCAWKFKERMLVRVLLPAVTALVISTVYLRYHYVIDVIAGALLAALTVFISPRMHRIFSRTWPRIPLEPS